MADFRTHWSPNSRFWVTSSPLECILGYPVQLKICLEVHAAGEEWPMIPVPSDPAAEHDRLWHLAVWANLCASFDTLYHRLYIVPWRWPLSILPTSPLCSLFLSFRYSFYLFFFFFCSCEAFASHTPPALPYPPSALSASISTHFPWCHFSLAFEDIFSGWNIFPSFVLPLICSLSFHV